MQASRDRWGGSTVVGGGEGSIAGLRDRFHAVYCGKDACWTAEAMGTV